MKTPRAGKAYICTWCGKEIQQGTKYYLTYDKHQKPIRLHYLCKARGE